MTRANRTRRIPNKLWIPVAIAVAVAIAGAVLFLSLWSPSQSPEQPGSGEAASAPFDDQEARHIESALNAETVDEQATALYSGLSSSFRTAGQKILPDGSKVRLERNSFTSHAVDMGEITADLNGPSSSRWLLLLAVENGHWQLYGTRALP